MGVVRDMSEGSGDDIGAMNDSGISNVSASNDWSLNNPTELTYTEICLDFFNFYYLAVIIIFGMVGNTLSFLVSTRTHLKLRSSSYYLAALALADLGFLFTLLIVWLNHVGIDLFNKNGWCQALVYGSSVSSCLSVWLTVAFTVERLIAVQYPLQRPYMCTVRRAKTIIGILSTVTFTCHIYSLFTAGITKGPRDQSVCELLPDYYRFMHIVNLMDTVVTLIIPLVLIVLMNTLIAKNLIVFSRTFKKPRSPSSSHLNSIQMKTLRLPGGWERDSGQGSVSNPSVHSNSHPPAGSSNHLGGTNHLSNTRVTALVTATTTVTGTVSKIAQLKPVTVRPKHHDASKKKDSPHDIADDKLQHRNILSFRIQYSITKMLLLISTVFIMLNLPSYVIRLHVFITEVVTPDTVNSSSVWQLQQFFMLLYYTNFSINFLLYSTCGATFRHCLCRFLREIFIGRRQR